MSHVKICGFVEWELQYFRDECNFLPEELEFFNLRAKDQSLTEILFLMRKAGYPCSESKINSLSKAVKRKILKVL